MPDATPDTDAPAALAPGRIFLTPAPGLRVAKPSGGHLAEGGEEVNDESYWQRRITDGDVADRDRPAVTADAGAQVDAAAPAAPAAGRTARARS